MPARIGVVYGHFGEALLPAKSTCKDWQGVGPLWRSFAASRGCTSGLSGQGGRFGGAPLPTEDSSWVWQNGGHFRGVPILLGPQVSLG